jgi:hypothetical protein
LWDLKFVKVWGQSLGKKYKIADTKLGMKLNIYLGPLGKVNYPETHSS